MEQKTSSSDTVVWRFQRMGGLDQVTLRGAEELRRLRELDPKLWAALSCPAAGLEFDARTLALVDIDKDGRIRIPEILVAVEWLDPRLDDPAQIVEPEEAMPLALIRADTDQGARLKATATAVLDTLGKKGSASLSQEDVMLAAAGAAENVFNGDGVLPPLEVFDPDVRNFINDALAVVGGVMDASGKAGVNRDIAAAFFTVLEDWRTWKDGIGDEALLLGDATAEAWELLSVLRGKIDDYFLRCDLAAYAPEGMIALHEPLAFADGLCQQAAASARHGLLDMERLAELPLSKIEADRPLNLSSGLNPAWRKPVRQFFDLAAPLLPKAESLSREDWEKLKERFNPYAEALAKKPAPPELEVTVAPTAGMDALSKERVDALLVGDLAVRFAELAEKDASVPASAADIADLERLVLYYLHLHRLLMNFVSFYDFYSLRRGAAFQYGTLFLDGRACRLCLPVTDQAAHATLAAFSQLCLVYCECRRQSKAEGEPAGMNIVAAVTAGDDDLLLEGRNGVFVDNTGQDWDARVVKIVSNPISIWQSLWQPYKRFGRMITEQIGKFAGAKQAKLEADAAQKAAETGAGITAPAAGAAPAQAFDIGKSVGIFAAIGLALGAIGTAVASLASALFALTWWQFPLILVGLFLIISGPSFVLAWLKLRKRNLGPLLEASGWAVNSRIPINLTLGGALTSKASLPANSSRSYSDPLQKRSVWPWFVLAAVVALAVAAGSWGWFNKDRLGEYFPAFNATAGQQQAPAARPGEQPAGAGPAPSAN